MNERISQLIEQCTDDEEFDGFRYFNKEKFAKLIVRECRLVVSTNFNECRTAYQMDNIILDHFGV